MTDKNLADSQEVLEEALYGLSARLLLSGFLDDADNHASYEKVVSAHSALRQPTQTDALREALGDATIDEIILNFAGGIVRVPSEHNPRGYVSYYRPREAMRAALQALEASNG